MRPTSFVFLTLVTAVGTMAGCSTLASPPRASVTPATVDRTQATPLPDDAVFAEPVEELGLVRWTRGVDAALARAKTSGKPVLVLFDEVPGCSTVKGFGNGALSHPLLAEAIETHFEPVVVYNNTEGDRAVCADYGEARWNNPVVRVLDASGSDIAERFAGPYTEAAFARSLVSALDTAGSAPDWLRFVADELEGTARADAATYSMACFWSGEAHLGEADGVLSTRTGWQGGREVVEVRYDPERTSEKTLTRHAAQGGARPMSGGTLSPTPSDDRYRLRHTDWRSVPMTPAQASRANAMLADGDDPSALFSPRQRALRGGTLGALGGSLDGLLAGFTR